MCRVCGKPAGTCGNRPAGSAVGNECPGDASCGGGQCNGSGACAYKVGGTTCATPTCTAGIETSYACAADHTCKSSTKNCSPYTCNAAAGVCLAGCKTHADCVGGSLCDRSAAHLTGLGVCVDPAKVLPVAS
ncbi:MAG: hypothetical protein QG573_824, partial [Acidobacteriota bacterium]|nr:hypothetical protein [Acidobacteriota bacterium]